MLKTLPEYHDATIVRSRDAAVIDSADIVVDVGAVYDPSKHRYDHHQREFRTFFDAQAEKAGIKLSSAGLVYKHFGKQVISILIAQAGYTKGTIMLEAPENQDPLEIDDLTAIYLRVYRTLMESMDAIDNGVNQYPSKDPPNYVQNTDLSSRVGRLNPSWRETTTSDAEIMSRFEKAMSLCLEALHAALEEAVTSYAPAFAYLRTQIKQQQASVGSKSPSANGTGQIDPSVLILPRYVPFSHCLHTLEETLALSTPINYVLYPEQNDNPASKWRLHAVAIAPSSFISRRALPEKWRGLRDDVLSSVTGIDGCIFVHATGFIGGGASQDVVTRMAKAALMMQD